MLLIAVLTANVLVSVAYAEGTGDDSVEAAREALNQTRDEGFAGSVLVACGDQILLHEHHGLNLEAQKTPSYWVASITKQFTAAGMLKLIEESDLTLETRLDEIFEEVPEDKALITVHQLLSHQSGLPQAYASSGLSDRDAALAAILALSLDEPPGARFGYSNDGYTLLAIITEVISGVPFETYLRRSVVDPAGLRHAEFWPQPAKEGETIPPLISPPGPEAYVDDWDFRGAVGMRLSVEDLHRWSIALDRHQVLSQQQRTQLYGPHVTTSSGLGAGYNWFWEEMDDGRAMLWTRGQEAFGANAVLYRFPGTELVIIAATHAGPAETGSGPVTGWSRQIRDLMIAAFGPTACDGSLISKTVKPPQAISTMGVSALSRPRE